MKYNKLYKKGLVILFILTIIPISLSFSSNQIPDNVDSEFSLNTSTTQETIFNFEDFYIEEEKTIILVHGYMDNHSVFNVLKGRNDFIDYYSENNMISVDYYGSTPGHPEEFDGVSLDTSITDIASMLAQYLIRAHSEGLINDIIDFVCHSMGGLVVRTMIKNNYPSIRANGMIIHHVATLASPHHGIFGAWTQGTLQTLEMDVSFSPLLPTLNDATNGGETPYSLSDTSLLYSDIKYSTYLGNLDLIINAHLVGNDQFHIEFKGIEHVSILYDNYVLTTLFKMISDTTSNNPQSFVLYSDADNPDIDGDFQLNWTTSYNAIDYTVYSYSSPITEINASLTLLGDGITEKGFQITDADDKSIYYLVTANNDYGSIPSNCIEIDRIPNEYELGVGVGLAMVGIIMGVIVTVKKVKKSRREGSSVTLSFDGYGSKKK